jgi:hypothetical protein
MRTSRGAITAIGLLLAASCSLFGGVEDLEGTTEDGGAGSGGTAGGSSTCTADKGCLGCQTCADYCACTKPFALQACQAECEDAGGIDAGDASVDAAPDAPITPDGSDASECDPTDYLNKSCLTVPHDTSCAQCMVDKCCGTVEACLKDVDCAGYMGCLAAKCTGSTDVTCGQQKCGSCFSAAISELTAVADCVSMNCSPECTGA